MASKPSSKDIPNILSNRIKEKRARPSFFIISIWRVKISIRSFKVFKEQYIHFIWLDNFASP